MIILNTVEEFDALINGEKPVLVDFFADWCGPCKMLGPVLEQVAAAHPEVEIVKVNVDQLGSVAQRFGIMSIPTYIMFKEGKALKEGAGYQPKPGIEKFIAEALA